MFIFTKQGVLKSKKFRKETPSEIQFYIGIHVTKNSKITFGFSLYPNDHFISEHYLPLSQLNENK